jgi:hypothetical protein
VLVRAPGAKAEVKKNLPSHGTSGVRRGCCELVSGIEIHNASDTLVSL